MLVTSTVERLRVPTGAERQAILDGPATPSAFAMELQRIGALHRIEVRETAPLPSPLAAARIGFWNAERLKYLGPSVEMLRRQNFDALLLCEVDLGMARSGNRHTLAELATALDSGYVFGVEFVELGLGDAREREWHRGETNAAGIHGGGIVSHRPLKRPALARLETSGRWFDGAFDERRVGGRIALMAEIDVAGTPVLLVSVHYESHTDPTDRRAQTRAMLDAIDAHAPGKPVLIGGDFNTSTFDRPTKKRPAAIEASLAEDPRRLVDPVRYEPMFDLLGERGYDQTACNLPLAPTERMRPDGTPAPPFGKIDWFFARGLRCTEATVLAAVDSPGKALSDHEVLAVTIEPA